MASKQIEKRKDANGNWYTKQEFIQFYNGTREWDNAELPNSVPPEPEMRISPDDGLSYTKEEFIEYYGGSAEWDAAKRERINKNRVVDLSALERRPAPDGRSYTKQEFLEFYGDLVEWELSGERMEKLEVSKSRECREEPQMKNSQSFEVVLPKVEESRSKQNLDQLRKINFHVDDFDSSKDSEMRSNKRLVHKQNTEKSNGVSAKDGKLELLLERKLEAKSGEIHTKEKFLEHYDNNDELEGESDRKNPALHVDSNKVLTHTQQQELREELTQTTALLEAEFAPLYRAAGMEPNLFSSEELSSLEKQLKAILLAEEKNLALAKNFSKYLAKCGAKYFQSVKLSKDEMEFLQQYEYQLKAARAKFRDIQSKRTDERKVQLKRFYKNKSTIWLKWLGKKKNLEEAMGDSMKSRE